MDYTQYLTYFSVVVTLILIFVVTYLANKVRSLEQVRKQFYSQKADRDIESILMDQGRLVTTLNKELKKTEDRLEKLIELNKNNIQKIGFVRFNPFDDAGGNISFAISLLDDKGNGVVISSLHGREGTRMYAKSVRNSRSESKLTTEEEQAIEKAK